MKKYLSLILLLAMFVSGCVKNELNDEQLRPISGRVFTASFELNDTRTYLEEGNMLRWNSGDQISLFDSNTLNRQYQFDGETGDNAGTFSLVNAPFGTGNDLNCHYALYPYASEVKIAESGVITATLPTEQSYTENSFGLGANTMVAVTKDVDDTFLKFKNVGGYFKLQLYGENITVKSITLTGNNNEKLAGKATITPAYGQNPTVVMNDDATTSITLDCGEGVKIGTTEETATAFWIVVPPTTFEEGITITVADIDGESFIKSTSNAVVIERNTIQPMAAFDIEIEKIPNNQIWYTSTDGQIVEPYSTNVFGANIVSNNYKDGKGVITFDGNVTTIGKEAFYLCESLTSVAIPDRVNKISESAFYYCYSLTSITIPDSVTKIGDRAFAWCERLTSITIPDSVTRIGDYAFAWCSSLKDVYCKPIAPPSCSGYMGDYDGVFYKNATGRKIYVYAECVDAYKTAWSIYADSIYADGNYPTDGETLTIQYTTSDGQILSTSRLPIKSNTYNNGIGEMVVYGSSTTIPHDAFYRCSSLTSVTIPNNVTTIGGYAFYECNSLTGVYITDLEAWCKIDFVSNAFGNPLKYAHNLYLNRELVEDLVIPSGITTLNFAAFYGANCLKSVIIPNSVISIKQSVFVSCTLLTSVTIGDSVIEIGDYAFKDCTSLKEVYCKSTTPPSLGGSYVFNGNASDRKIYVPEESLSAYKSAEGWSNYASSIEGYDF